MLTQSSGQAQTNPNPKGLIFSRFLEQSHVQNHASISKNALIVEDSTSFKELFKELSTFLESHSLGQGEINYQYAHRVEEPSSISLISETINSKLEESKTFNELIENMNQPDTIVGVLTIMKAIEDSSDGSIDLTSLYSKINSVLESEFKGYSLQEPQSISSIIQEIDKLSSDEKSLIEGQILLSRWALTNNSSTVFIADKLITANNNLQDIKKGSLVKQELSNNIINQLFSNSVNNELENTLKSIFTVMDFSKVQAVFQQTVQSLYGNELISEPIIVFGSTNQDMTVSYQTFTQKNNLFTIEEIGFKHLEPSKSIEHDIKEEVESTRELFQKLGLTELVEEAGINLPSSENITVLEKQTHSNNQSEKDSNLGGFDLYGQLLKQIFVINSETITQDHFQTNNLTSSHSTDYSTLKNMDKTLNLEHLMKDMKLLSTIIDSLSTETTPLIENILNISKVVGEVADEFSLDINDVMNEIGKIIDLKENLPNNHLQVISDTQNSIKENLAIPLINGIHTLIKGVYLLPNISEVDKSQLYIKIENLLKGKLSNKGSIITEETSLIDKTKIEGMIKTQLFELNSINENKHRLIENLPALYEKLASIFYRENKLTKMSENVFKEEAVFNDLKDNKSLSINSITKPESTVNDLLNLNGQKDNGLKSNKIIEEQFILKLDRFVVNYQADSNGNQKSDANLRQEFTNQLVNAFKNSRFGQMPNGANRLVIKLNPVHLGALTVRLVQKNGEMIARIITSTKSAKELLDHSIHQLKQALPSIQIEIDRFEIPTEEQAKTLKDHSDQNQKNEKEEQKAKREEHQESEKSFIDNLKELLNKTV